MTHPASCPGCGSPITAMPFPERVRLTDTTAFAPFKVGDIVAVLPQQQTHDIRVEGGWVLYPGTWEPA